MVSVKVFILAALTGVACAVPCKPTPTLPVTGGASELPAVPSGLVLKKIALGHGIQNYSCADSTSSPVAKGALAVLYDITGLYPGTPRTGLSSQTAFDTLTTTALWTQAMPLNLVDTAAAAAGVVLPSASYAATANPFPAPKDLKLGNLAPIKFLGHHYFDAASIPMFDLPAAGLKAHVGKKAAVPAPATADKGPLGTGAVPWLQLLDLNDGVSVGLTAVYRVITAGGNSAACSVTGPGLGSVPYAAQYWFFG